MNAQPDFKTLFASLAKLAGIDQASGDTVPLPDSNGTMTEHLFVNLLRSVPAEKNPEDTLAAFRATVQQALLITAEELNLFPYDSVVVSLFCVPTEGTNIRLYRTRVGAKDLELVRSRLYTDFCKGEESHYPPIRALLSTS